MDDSIERLIRQYQEREIYRSLDAGTLAGIADDRVELAIVDCVHVQLEGNEAFEREVLAGVAEGARALYMTWLVQTQVIHGGFSRYYRSSAGQFAPEAVAAFEFFGAHQHACLMREANRLHAEEQVLGDREDLAKIYSFFERYTVPPLHWLDDRFYKLDESLSALRIAKIRAAPALFLTN